MLAKADEQKADSEKPTDSATATDETRKANRSHSEKRTNAATATRKTKKADRLRDLQRFVDEVYEALDKDGYETGENGDRKPLPVSAGDLHTLFCGRHPEHKVARSTFDDDLGKIARVKPGPKRYQIKELAEMLVAKFSVD